MTDPTSQHPLSPPQAPAGPAAEHSLGRASGRTRSRAAKRPPGRAWTGWLLAVAGGTGCFVLMSNDEQLPHGALWGALALLLCVGGLLHALGLWQSPCEGSVPLEETWLGPRAGEPRWSAPLVSLPLAFALVVIGALLLGGGALPWLFVLALLLLAPAARSRPGLLVFVVCSLLYLPLLGVFGLWDPWETHYGEVAREILARDDWISLWWAQDRWFWSKPIYIFWSEALLWSASGIGFQPDSHFQHSEWALRLPIVTVAIGALLALYTLLARVFHPRAGVLAALVLATTPYFGFLSHQAITDMPFVGNMTIAVVLLLFGLQEDPEREVASYRVGPVALSAQHLVLGAFLVLALPQALYLATRNVTLEGWLFAWHFDEFVHGSAGNADVPGNFALRVEQPRIRSLFVQPMAQALYWGVGIAVVSSLLRRERRAQSLYMFAFYIACALAFMAKGIPGFALPGLFALLYLLCWNRWSLLFSGRLRVAAGALTLITVGMPWFVAMFIRHGRAFTDRLLIHDHINRLTKGVHGDTSDIHYFLAQLGYGTFPWVALLPGALGAWVLLRPAAEPSADPRRVQRQREVLGVLGLWFAVTFTLFSAMTTKFHHYIFPAVPAASALAGLVLDDLWGAGAGEHSGARRRYLPLALSLVAPLPLVLGVAGFFGDPRGVLPAGLSAAEQAVWVLQHPWPGALCLLLLAVGAGLLAAAIRLDRDSEHVPPPARAGQLSSPALALVLLGGAVVCAFVGRDLSWTTAERPAGSERLVQLFIYKYERPFPPHLDYRPLFSGFAVVGTGIMAVAAIPALRRMLSRALLGFGLLFGAFCLNVYMMDLSPHWSQRALIERYYEERKSPDEALVAWQMNWKGENFYTGNRVNVFVDLNNTKIENWIEQREGSTAYFVLEHSRLDRFKRMVAPRKVEELTTERDNNKFLLVRVKL